MFNPSDLSEKEKTWLRQHGGRNHTDVLIDQNGKYVEMEFVDKEKAKVYLADYI